MTVEIPWGPTGELVFNRTYSRTKPDGTKETWPETVERVVDGNLALAGHHLYNEREDLIQMMTEFKIVPAGRHLWASGVKNANHLFNCWVAPWTDDPTEHFRFTFLRLMEGGGVGANYSNHYLDQYPPIAPGPYRVHIVCSPDHPDYDKLSGVLSSEFDAEWPGAFPVQDSREGWADALCELLRAFYDGAEHPDRVFDVSRVRGEGARLMTFGGRASGPLPLARMLHEVSEVMSRRGNDVLTGLDAMAIDHAIATCVVSGGNRRSARMAIMRWDDPEVLDFIRIKQDTGSHWTTNISVEVDDLFWAEVENVKGGSADRVLYAISAGMLSNGEPGFWDSSLSNEGEPNPVIGTNPCVTGDTMIATVDGPRPIAELALAGDDVEVYSWDPETKTPVIRWMRRPHLTRTDAETVKVTFDSGLVVRCTPDHGFYTFRGKKVKAKNLKPDQSIRAFSASRDGSGHERVHAWDSNRNVANHQWTHRMKWENEHGPVPPGDVIAHLDGDARNNELTNLAAMSPYDHASYDWPKRHAAGFGAKGVPNHKVVSVEPAGTFDVYNGMVEGSHTYIILDPQPVAGHMSGIVSANCGEIPLEAYEPCNLGHVNLAAFADESYEELHLAHELMTRFLIRGTFAQVNDPNSREVLDRNRRIGVGHFGVAGYVVLNGYKYSEPGKLYEVLDELYEVVWEAATDYADALRIPVPVKCTTVAPTGTIAKLPGVSEGIHPIFAKYFVRRVRFSDVDEDQRRTVEDYRARGYLVEPCFYAPETTVVAIPTVDSLMADVVERFGQLRAEEIVESAGDLTVEDMLSFQTLYQEHWADNAVSYTVNLDRDAYTAGDIADVLRSYAGRIKGATVFPDLGMPQSPYERLTKEQFQAELDRVGRAEIEDSVDENCSSGACPVR